ncbi:MAG: hypothetical protein KI791_04690 [Cyclobacteriaceae bacterium]|nr:hypothetical protein [Cyclobacteriaceae bacterium SS2]
MNKEDIAERIIKLKNADLELRNKLIQSRQLGEGYNEEMASLHNRNAQILVEIIDTIGYLTTDKVGKEASEAAWLIIQHAIGQPTFMKKSAKLLAVAVNENKADQIGLAYLTDRIAVLEGRPQLHGTQFDWDQNGEMKPNQYDDIAEVNQRRKALGLNTLEEQTEIIQKKVQNENQQPPIDLEERKRKYNNWRESVGWIN